IAFAHARGIVHRDLKPSQVMVGNFGDVFLMDWGLAVTFLPPEEQREDMAAACATHIDYAANPAGTVAFMAPEQTEKTAEHVGPWTDVYLLGGILYYLLTGTYPHPQRNSVEAFQHASRGNLEPPEQRAPDTSIPPELSQLAMKATARDRNARFES